MIGTVAEKPELERHADDNDLATVRELADTAYRVRAAQAKQASVRLDEEFDGQRCVTCDEVIPAGRVNAMKFSLPVDSGFRTFPHHTDVYYTADAGPSVLKHGTDKCVHCQSVVDKSNKLYASTND